MSIKITVLMPSYNDETTIKSSLDSLYQQNYEDWELIIINDGGSDLKPLINDYLVDKRILLLNSDENKGQLHALQLALPYIHGQIVTLLHSDDLLVPNSFSRLVSYFNDSNIDGIFCDLILINENQNKTGTLKVVNALNRFSPVDILMRTADTGLIPDIFFVTREYFDKQVRINYISNRIFYWLPYSFLISSAYMFVPPNLKKVNPWYQYTISENNYKYSSICQFLLALSRIRISMLLSKKYSVYFNFWQSLFWKGLYNYTLFKNVYSYTFHPLFRVNNINNISDKTYYNNLQRMVKRIISSIYFEESKPPYFSYLLEWFKNRNNRKWQLNENDVKNFYIKDFSEVGLFKEFQNDKSSIRQTLHLLSCQGIDTIIVDNLSDYNVVSDFLLTVALPIHIELREGC